MTRSLTVLLLALQIATVAAQVHRRKEVQIAAGLTLGGFEWNEVDGEGRATGSSSGPMMTLPLTAHYGLGNRIALGGYGEAGIMVQLLGDANVLWNFGIEPKFFWLNRKRFGASVSFRYGASRMNQYGRPYSGTNYAALLSAHWRFTERSGLQVQLRYLRCRMDGEGIGAAGITPRLFETGWGTAGVLYVRYL